MEKIKKIKSLVFKKNILKDIKNRLSHKQETPIRISNTQEKEEEPKFVLKEEIQTQKNDIFYVVFSFESIFSPEHIRLCHNFDKIDQKYIKNVKHSISFCYEENFTKLQNILDLIKEFLEVKIEIVLFLTEKLKKECDFLYGIMKSHSISKYVSEKIVDEIGRLEKICMFLNEKGIKHSKNYVVVDDITNICYVDRELVVEEDIKKNGINFINIGDSKKLSMGDFDQIVLFILDLIKQKE